MHYIMNIDVTNLTIEMENHDIPRYLHPDIAKYIVLEITKESLSDSGFKDVFINMNGGAIDDTTSTISNYDMLMSGFKDEVFDSADDLSSDMERLAETIYSVDALYIGYRVIIVVDYNRR